MIIILTILLYLIRLIIFIQHGYQCNKCMFNFSKGYTFIDIIKAHVQEKKKVAEKDSNMQSNYFDPDVWMINC